MRTTPLLLVVTLGMLSVAPLAGAFHGSPYSASGVAVGLNGAAYQAEVEWTGWWFQTYIVHLTDPVTGAVAVHHEFRGSEQNQGGGPFASLWEIFIYHGFDTATAGQMFDIRGFQQITISPTLQQMVYVGHYKDYQLVLAVAGDYT